MGSTTYDPVQDKESVYLVYSQLGLCWGVPCYTHVLRTLQKEHLKYSLLGDGVYALVA